MDKVKKHFEEAAGVFDERVLKTVPFYRDMIDALVLAMPFDNDGRIRVVDLGCGTGTIAKRIKESYPKAAITCVDFAENMIKIAQSKLGALDDISYVMSDCLNFDFSAGYDAVVSSLTLHHIRDEDVKKKFFRKVFGGLKNKGVFYLADLVLGSNDYLQKLNMKKWGDFQLQHCSPDETREREKRYSEEDRPFELMDEIEWLKDAGFREVDVIWKYYHFAVYGGRKG
ncbi:MAG: class I SAM-dependent methyltransferase [Phycisphaerae bacterium]